MGDPREAMMEGDAAPFQRKLLLFLTVGWALVASNSGLISFGLALIRKEWGLTGTQTGVMLNSYLIGMLIGAFAMGRAADIFGRKPASIFSLIILSVGTALCSVAGNWISMSAFRFLAGVGATGYMVAASTLLSEFSPTAKRGRYVALLESGWAFGWILASYLGLIIAPSRGWRPVFATGVLPLFPTLLVYLLPESPRFLFSVGRTEEAQVLAERAGIEVRFEKREKIPLRRLFSAEYSRKTAMLLIHWFCIVLAYWGIFLWFPSILYARGIPFVKSLEYSFIIALAQIPGYWSGAYLIEKVGRKLSLSSYMALAGIGSLIYWFASTDVQALGGAIAISFFNLGAWGVTYAYTPELYPTQLRGSGSGWANSFGRLGGIIGPYLVGALLELTGSYVAPFLLFAVVHIISAVSVVTLGIETMGKKLEEI